jgi:hypothetical protein
VVIYYYPLSLPNDQLIGALVVIGGMLANAAAAILGRWLNRAGKPVAAGDLPQAVARLMLCHDGPAQVDRNRFCHIPPLSVFLGVILSRPISTSHDIYHASALPPSTLRLSVY